MVNRFLNLAIVILLLNSCTSIKSSIIATTDNTKYAAINNAILDFTNNCRLYKKDSVFIVSYYDTVYQNIRVKIDHQNSKTVRGDAYSNIVAVNIMGASDMKILFLPEFKDNLPNQYIEKDGKLFYWYDNRYELSEDMLAKLHKYGLITNDKIAFFDNPNDDSKKGVSYYFCRNDLSKYKKVIRGGFKRYTLPKVRCN